MFKNALLYRIAQWPPVYMPDIEERLGGAQFVAGGPTQPESCGWVPPRGEANGALCEVVGREWVLRHRTETRSVPANAVKQRLAERLDAIEKETGRRPRGKLAKELKAEVVHELMPRAFPKQSDTVVWLSPGAQLVLVGANSAKRADAIVTRLLEAMGLGFKLDLLQTELTPGTAMATWLADREGPAGFSIDRQCELKQPDSEKATVRYARHTLDIDEVAEHVRQGKLPTQLAMTWNGRVSFVMTEGLSLKNLQLLDVTLEGQGADAPTEPRDGFDADVAITTGELRLLIPDLLNALGGAISPNPQP